MNARDYHRYKTSAMAAVLESYQRLRGQYEVVLVEGAGSPAEINLRARDIANMGFAEAVDCPVILVADIDRGGVFAHLVGTLDCLSETERARIAGFVINRFRGDLSLLQPGLDWLEQRTGKPVLAVLPYLHGLHLDAEDAVASSQSAKGNFRVVVPVLPRISNHTDFDALRAHADIDLQFIGAGQAIARQQKYPQRSGLAQAAGLGAGDHPAFALWRQAHRYLWRFSNVGQQRGRSAGRRRGLR